ncbi:MAG: tetratricopeptide repeat protein, partial [Caulobacterales bacterium]|nr:tetratricopeptide repeat protein [Caulobacterales bacterium]
AALAGIARIKTGERPEAFAATPAAGASAAVFAPAATLATRSRSELAAVYLRLAIYLDEGNSLARYFLGDYLRARDLGAEARQVLAETPASSTYHVPARVTAAWTFLDEERDEEAVALLEALVAETDAPLARVALGDSYRAVKRFEEGVEIYSRLIAETGGLIEVRHWRWFYFRGICLERSGRWDEAEADFQKALELVPDQPSVMNYLGYTWVDRGERLDEAFELIRRAVDLRPDAGYIVDSLGWAHYKLGQYEEAVVHLERAVELEPDDPTINDHLGDAYWQVGRRLEAVFQWRRALSLNPEEIEIAKIEAKLDDGGPQDASSRLASPHRDP